MKNTLWTLLVLAGVVACGQDNKNSKTESAPEPAAYNIVIARVPAGGDLSQVETRAISADASVLESPEAIEQLFASADEVTVEAEVLAGDDTVVEGSTETYRSNSRGRSWDNNRGRNHGNYGRGNYGRSNYNRGNYGRSNYNRNHYGRNNYTFNWLGGLLGSIVLGPYNYNPYGNPYSAGGYSYYPYYNNAYCSYGSSYYNYSSCNGYYY